MNLFCTEEHELLRASVRDFARQVIEPVANELDKNEAFSYEITEKMGVLDLFEFTY